MFIKRWFPFASLHPSHWLLIVIIVFYSINGIFYLQSQSITFDESSFLSYATRLLKGHPERIEQADNSKMPVVIVNLIPRAVSQLLHPGLKKTDNGESDVYAGRYVTLMISILIILVTYYWSKELYGTTAGLFSAFLISFCPNTIANAGLVTTDSFSSLFLLVSMYYLWKFCQNPGIKRFILVSVFIAFSQLVKQSLFHLYVLFPVILLIYYWRFPTKIKWKTVVVYTFLFLFINWLVINLAFYFRESNMLLGNYHFYSSSFQTLQEILPNHTPIPLPKAFVTGLDLGKYYDQIGGGDIIKNTHGNVTILGNVSSTGGFWYYYFVSIFYKTPIPFLIFVVSGILMLLKTQSLAGFLKNEFFLWAPVLYFLLYMSFVYNTHIGIRQIIFIYPFLFIGCGILMRLKKTTYRQIILSVLCLFLIFSVLQYWRNYYPYTNEFITNKKMAYQYVGAANLEFGQGQLFFDKFLKEHPEIHVATDSPAVGLFLMNTNDYLDVWNTHRFDWLIHNKPIDHVAYNGLLIKVTPEDLEKFQKANPDK